MPGPTRIPGLAELFRDLAAIDAELPGEMRAALKEAAGPVADDVRARLGELKPPPGRTISGVRVYVRSAGTVSIEQARRKTTGKRPDWGVTQMKDAFLPAAETGQDEAVAAIERARDEVLRRHGFHI